MSRSCVRSHRCAFVVIRVMNMIMMTTIVRMTTIVSASQLPNTRRNRLRQGRLCALC
jgi:hypothetical protein